MNPKKSPVRKSSIENKLMIVGEQVQEILTSEDRVVCLDEVYNLAQNYMSHFQWTSMNLEILCRVVSKTEGVVRVDLPIPTSAPISIFKGHHKMKAVTYFIRQSENQEIEIERAKNHLNTLTQIVLEERQSKLPIQKEAKTNSIQSEEKTSEPYKHKRSVQCYPYGFLNQSRLRMHLLHIHFFITFGYNLVTFDQLLDSLSFDLAIKVVGVHCIHPLFEIFPQIRYFTLGSLPKIID